MIKTIFWFRGSQFHKKVSFPISLGWIFLKTTLKKQHSSKNQDRVNIWTGSYFSFSFGLYVNIKKVIYFIQVSSKWKIPHILYALSYFGKIINILLNNITTCFYILTSIVFTFACLKHVSSKPVTLHWSYTLDQFLLSLGIQPTTLLLLKL